MTGDGSAPTLSGSALVVLAALFWGLSGGIGGILTADDWDPVMVSFYRGAIGLLFVAGWLAVRPGGSGLGSARLWGWSALAGLGVAGNFALYFVSIAEGSVAVAATLLAAGAGLLSGVCYAVFIFGFKCASSHGSPQAILMVAFAVVVPILFWLGDGEQAAAVLTASS